MRTIPVVRTSSPIAVHLATWRQRLAAAWRILTRGSFSISDGVLEGENPELNRVHLLLDAVEASFEGVGVEEHRTWEGAREYLRTCLRCARNPDFWDHARKP